MSVVTNEVDKRPIFTPYVSSQSRTKTADGISVGSEYLKRYYSVIDAEIYFGNNYVEDIHSIFWEISQNMRPLFGYNSYIYDEIARGNRIIQGTFEIDFTSPNYLFKLLESAQLEAITNITSFSVPTKERVTDQIVGAVNTSIKGTIEQNDHAPIWPQTFDIDVVLGEKNNTGNATHIILEGVAIISASMGTVAGGGNAPITEQYKFFARDIKT